MPPNAPFFTPYQRQTFLWVAIALAWGVVLWLLRSVLTPFLLGAILAYILQPGVALMVRHRVPRALAALAMILLFTLGVAVLVLLLFFVVEKEGPQLKQQIPVMFAHLQSWLQPRLAQLGLGHGPDFNNLRDLAMSHVEDSAQSIALTVWQSALKSGNLVISLTGTLVMVPLVLFYLLYDWNRMLARMQRVVPRRWLARTLELAREMDRMLAQYLRGQFLVMAVLAVYYTLALTIAGFDTALPIGVFTGLAVLIPYLGFATGLALAFVAALLQFGSWYGIGAVAVVYGAGQVLEGFFLTPRLVGERIGLHPLAVIFALLAFGQLFGLFGVLLALPASAVLVVALREIRRSYYASTFYKN